MVEVEALGGVWYLKGLRSVSNMHCWWWQLWLGV